MPFPRGFSFTVTPVTVNFKSPPDCFYRKGPPSEPSNIVPRQPLQVLTCHLGKLITPRQIIHRRGLKATMRHEGFKSC